MMIMMRILSLLAALCVASASYADINTEAEVKRAHGSYRSEASGACVKHSCDHPLVEVPRESGLLRLRSVGGCADEGVRLFGPGKGLAVERCCDVAQACGSVCGTTAKMCRDAFESCAERACRKADDAAQCDADAETVKTALRMDSGRCQKHLARQNATCECAAADAANDRRTAALAAFLKVHEPDGPPVTDYMAKVTDARKFGLVATKLLAKFPKAVWPQPDPQPDKKHRIGGDGAAFDPLAESLRLLEGEAREAAATEASLLDLDAAERPEL